MGQVCGIISIKGGVGKTTAVIALGAALARDFNKKVLLVDANFSAPNLGLYLGCADPKHTIQEVMAGKIEPDDAVLETEHGFYIMAGAKFKKKINPYKLRNRVIKELKDDYDFILIDSSPNLNEEILATMVASDRLFVVTTPDIVTLSTTLMAIRSAEEKKTYVDGLILNKVYRKRFELRLEDIEDAVKCHVLAVIPHDIRFLEAMSRNMPSTVYRLADSTVEYKKLAAALAGEHYKDYRPKSIIRNIFWSHSKHEINRDMFREHGT